MPKAIAVQAVFLIAVIAISLFFTVGIFSGWIGETKKITSDATCRSDWIGFCSALLSDLKPKYEWNTGCSNYNIIEPTENNIKETCCKSRQFEIFSKCK